MAILTSEIGIGYANAGSPGRLINDLIVASGTTIYKGAFVSQLMSGANAGKLVPTSTALAGPAIGRATHTVVGDGALPCVVSTENIFHVANGTSTQAFLSTTRRGVPAYAVDDHTAGLTSAGGTLQRLGYFLGLETDGRVIVYVEEYDYAGSSSDIGETPPLTIVTVRGKPTANVASLAALTVAGQDGLTYVAGERLLLGNDQTTASQRGVYVVGTVAAGSAPITRALDADGSDELVPGMLVHVSEGTVNADTWWFLATNAPITVDSTSLSFVKLPTAAELASTAASLGANLVGYQDAGSFTVADDVDEALDEVYQGLLSVQKHIPIPLGGVIDSSGVPMAAFVSAGTPTMGSELTNSKTACIRWNNDAAPGAVFTNVAMPQDLDDTAAVTFHALVSKTGATVGDATSLTVGAFEHTVGALHDADSDFGGVSNAVVGNATAKTVTELIVTFAAADIHAAPSSICLSIKPTAGTLGTDDFLVHSMWLEYKAKLLTS